MMRAHQQPITLRELVVMSARSTLNKVRSIAIELRLTHSRRVCELMDKRILNDLTAKRLHPELTKVLDEQIKEARLVICAEHMKQCTLNFELANLQ